jgi:hypothetical protein
MAKHVIFSRNVNNSALSTERIQQLAPAAFSTTKADRLTDRYVSLNTSDIIPVMQDYGYTPVQAAQKRSRKNDPAHSAHMLAFAKTWDIDFGTGDIRPEIILYNSHDGTGSVKLFAGCFRFICSNGIVAGDGFQSRIYHSKALNGFEEMLRNTVATLPTMMERLERLRTVQLNPVKALLMAQRGVATRWDMLDEIDNPTKGVYATIQTAGDVLKVSRYEDMPMDAFTVFNRIQEGVIRGNAFVKSLSDKHPNGVMRKARAVNSVKENIRINSELWNIAEDIAFA